MTSGSWRCSSPLGHRDQRGQPDHEGAARALLQALEGSGKTFIHTSGSSIVGTQSAGERVDAIFDEETPLNPSTGRAARVALNEFILSSRTKDIRPIIICPSLI